VNSSLTSIVLVGGVIVFIAIASATLIWDGLATEFTSGAVRRRASWRSRARLAVGVLGFALALWVGLGLLTRAW
jgi:hypothetical protein